MKRIHKSTGWTREHKGFNRWIITPTDDSGTREVAFMSPGSWANLDADDRAKQDTARVVLVSGDPLPQWAQEWLEAANLRSVERAQRNFANLIDAANFDRDMRDANSY